MTGAEEKSDKSVDLFGVRSVLFLPASNPRAIAKAREAGSDLVVLDLEDAVRGEDKATAGEAAGLIAGTNDLRADLRLPLDATREPISAALQFVVLSARAAGIAVFDGVYNKLDDLDGFAREAEAGRRLGFDGKSLIHPS